MEVKEKLFNVIALKETTRGCDIKAALGVVLRKAEIGTYYLNCTPSTTGCKNGLIWILKSDTNFPDIIIHYIIHRENITAKYFKYEHVINALF